MEKQKIISNSAVLLHRGQTFTLASLTEEILQKITIQEAKIVDARIKGFSLNQIESEKLKKDINLLVFKLVGISNASLPPTEDYALILGDEFMIFLLEHGYEQFTEEEVLLSFRLNAKGIKNPSGNEPERVLFKGIFNITQAAIILENYMNLRIALDRKLQNHIDGYE